MEYVIIISNGVITVLAIGALVVRIEHRLTKIEAELLQLQEKVGRGCNWPGREQRNDV